MTTTTTTTTTASENADAILERHVTTTPSLTEEVEGNNEESPLQKWLEQANRRDKRELRKFLKELYFPFQFCEKLSVCIQGLPGRETILKLRQKGKKIHIVLLGRPQGGKSSTINSFYNALHIDKYYVSLAKPGNGRDMENTSVCPYLLTESIVIWDTPGKHEYVLESKELLLNVCSGTGNIPVLKSSESVFPIARKRADVVVLVIPRTISDEGLQKYKDTIAILKSEEFQYLILFTKMDIEQNENGETTKKVDELIEILRVNKHDVLKITNLDERTIDRTDNQGQCEKMKIQALRVLTEIIKEGEKKMDRIPKKNYWGVFNFFTIFVLLIGLVIRFLV